MLYCHCMTTLAAPNYEDQLKEMLVDDEKGVITLVMDDEFGKQEFTEKSVRKIYKKITKDVHKALPWQCRYYDVRIYSMGKPIESLIANGMPVETEPKHTPKRQHGGWWGDVAYDGNPWVRNISKPHQLSGALNGKHISLWASHGRYYKNAHNAWEWQRPNLFCTSEDLFTQTIVVPFLMPMLENAGANESGLMPLSLVSLTHTA